MKITDETKISALFKIKEFQEFRHLLLPDMGILNVPLKRCRLKVARNVWPNNQIAEGLSYMLTLAQSGEKLFYPLYKENDYKKNLALKQVGLFHFPIKEKSKFVVICAGGGYTNVCSCVEAFPIAKRMNEMGYHAFVVNYRYNRNALAPNPIDDLAKALSFIMKNNEVLNVDGTDYAIAGFSAGGHLVGNFGTEKNGYKTYGLPKPGALFLAYPVVTMGESAHKDSREKFLGKANACNQELQKRYSVEEQITEDYPPCYTWQCARDNIVSIENTRLLTEKLKCYHIPHRYRTYDSNVHGWGLGDGTLAEGWLEEAVMFWNAAGKENSSDLKNNEEKREAHE